jgi:hypothetical protein
MRKIDLLMATIIGGDWRPRHHQGIAFDSNGDLGDGQHRLIAGALSDTPIGVLVTSDVPFDDVLDVVDTGTSRTPGQALRMRGWDMGEEAAPLAARLAAYVHQRQHGVKPQLSGLQVQRFATDNKGVIEQAMDIAEKSKATTTDPVYSVADSSMVAAVLLFDGWSVTKAAEFIAAVQQGLAPYDTAPTQVLERLLDKSNRVNKSKEKIAPMERVALSVKAASMFQDRIGVTKLTWNEKKEGLPTVRKPALQTAAE